MERRGLDIWSVPRRAEIWRTDIRAHANPSLDQTEYRGRNDDGTEQSATWKALSNTNWTQNVDENFRVRFVVQETAGGAENNVTFQLQYNLNGAGWVNVTTTSTVVRGANTQLADTLATTDQIGGTGTFLAGEQCETGLAATSRPSYVGNDHSEVEFGLSVVSADVADTDSIQLRVIRSGGSLEAWSATPTITVSEAAAIPEGTATVTGAGTSTATGSKVGSGTAAVTGAGSTTATGEKRAIGTADATGTGTVTATGGVAPETKTGTASVTGTGSVAATGTKRASGAATTSGAGATTATGDKRAISTAAVAGAGTVVATGAAVSDNPTGTATVTGAGAVGAAGEKWTEGTAGITGTSSVVSTGAPAGTPGGGAGVSGTGSVATFGDKRAAGGTTLVAILSVTATGLNVDDVVAVPTVGSFPKCKAVAPTHPKASVGASSHPKAEV